MLPNRDQSPEHFSIDPKEHFAAVKDIRARELVLLGIFHLHLGAPVRPLEEDIRLAFDEKSKLSHSFAGGGNTHVGGVRDYEW